MKPFQSRFFSFLAFLRLTSFLLPVLASSSPQREQNIDSRALSTNQSNPSKITIDLHYQNLKATVLLNSPLVPVEINPQLTWKSLAHKIIVDAHSKQPFASGGATGRYDIWPKLTIDALGRAQEPTYATKVALFAAPGCRQIDANILVSFARVFLWMASQTQVLHFSFTGTITDGQDMHFQFTLFSTGIKPALSEKVRNIQQGDLDALNHGRSTILSLTTSTDLLLFIGNTGAYFYHTLNRPGDSSKDYRNAHLIPVSQSPLLSQMRDRPEYVDFQNNVLRPALATLSKSRHARVILIDFAQHGTTVVGLQGMFRESRLWPGPFYFINVMSPQDPHGQPMIPGVVPLVPINIGSYAELLIIANGGLGRVVPTYPWFFWDVPWQDVEYPDQIGASSLINTLQRNRIAGSVDGNGTISSSATAFQTNGSLYDSILNGTISLSNGANFTSSVSDLEVNIPTPPVIPKLPWPECPPKQSTLARGVMSSSIVVPSVA